MRLWVYERHAAAPDDDGQPLYRYDKVDTRSHSGDIFTEQVPARGEYTQWGQVLAVGWTLATAKLVKDVHHIAVLIVDPNRRGPFIDEAPVEQAAS